MLTTLIKKQIYEVFSWVYRDNRKGENRKGGAFFGFILLYVFLFGWLGFIFFIMADGMCAPLAASGYGWLFFAIMGLIAMTFGVIGSVFNTATALYRAKDNDLLLSMPIKPRYILIARLVGVLLSGAFYELVVMLPAVIAYFVSGYATPMGIVWSLAAPLVLALLITALTCIIGWFVALIMSRLKNSSFLTMVIYLLFFGAYLYFYNKANQAIENVVANPVYYGKGMKSILYPFYMMGRGMMGESLPMLIFIATVLMLCAAVYLVLSHSFIKIATTNRGNVKPRGKARAGAQRSVNGALFAKELGRFLSSPVYMMNSGLGSLFMVLIAVLALFKGGDLIEAVAVGAPFLTKHLPAIALCGLCFSATTNVITAPSVSLEGSGIWIAHSLPVSALQVLRAKIKLHLVFTLPPVLLLGAAVIAVIKPDALTAVLMLAVAVSTVLFTAVMGLALNLKMPNLNWTSETVAVKQGFAVMLSIFGGWGVVIALSFAYYFTCQYLAPTLFFCLATALLLLGTALVYGWIKKRGTAIFESL